MNLLAFLTNPVIAPLIIGLGSTFHIEAAVEYFKSDWKLPRQFSPYIALILALGVNFAIAQVMHLEITQTLVDTFLTTAGACYWHEFSS